MLWKKNRFLTRGGPLNRESGRPNEKVVASSLLRFIFSCACLVLSTAFNSFFFYRSKHQWFRHITERCKCVEAFHRAGNLQLRNGGFSNRLFRVCPIKRRSYQIIGKNGQSLIDHADQHKIVIHILSGTFCESHLSLSAFHQLSSREYFCLHSDRAPDRQKTTSPSHLDANTNSVHAVLSEQAR